MDDKFLIYKCLQVSLLTFYRILGWNSSPFRILKMSTSIEKPKALLFQSCVKAVLFSVKL